MDFNCPHPLLVNLAAKCLVRIVRIDWDIRMSLYVCPPVIWLVFKCEYRRPSPLRPSVFCGHKPQKMIIMLEVFLCVHRSENCLQLEWFKFAKLGFKFCLRRTSMTERAVFRYNLACDIDDCDIYSMNLSHRNSYLAFLLRFLCTYWL